jgi:hypothetical protein
MCDNRLHSMLLLLAGLGCLAATAAGAQTPTAPALTVTQLTPSADDQGSFGPPLEFGEAVGISGNTAVVGIPLYDLLDPTQSFAVEEGRVAVFTQNSNGTWTRTASVQPADRQPNESAFGFTLALANNVLVVGSSAAVRIFVNEGGTWTQTAKLPETSVSNMVFDGRYLAFAADQQPVSGSTTPSYVVYLYSVDTSGRPQLLGTLSPPNLSALGIALANGILAVSARDENSGNGMVYVYSERSPTPTVPQVLTAGGSTPESSFGNSIAIWNQTILVGAPNADLQPNDNTGGSFSGAVFVFAPGAHGWVRTQKIVPNNSAAFGTAIVVNQAGALISAPYSDDNYANILGGTQVYLWQGNQLVFAQNIAGATGTSMALSGTGNAAIIGTSQQAHFAFYEYADVVTLAPGGSASH